MWSKISVCLPFGLGQKQSQSISPKAYFLSSIFDRVALYFLVNGGNKCQVQQYSVQAKTYDPGETQISDWQQWVQILYLKAEQKQIENIWNQCKLKYVKAFRNWRKEKQLK